MENALPYRIMDADNHFNEPRYCYERYIDPKLRDLAIRYVKDADGNELRLCAGKPSKFSLSQITYSDEELERMIGQLPAIDEPAEVDEEEAFREAQRSMPGVLLNRLNPLKGLDDEQRRQLIIQFRNQSEAYGNRDLRIALMDDQGIEAALMFPASAHDIEYELADNIPAMYANARAFNRWMHDEVGYAYENRMFLPPYIPFADVELAVEELERVLAEGAPMIQFKSGHAHGGPDDPGGGRSIADPVFDPIWSRLDEAGTKIAVHLGGTDYQKYGADWGYDPESTFGDFDAFQWVMYWGDRPAMELTAGMILHNLFGRFPNVRVCLAEQGTVWLPYTLRKMDHAFLMGRKARWGNLERRPSEIFSDHFIVAPYPEENVARVLEVSGVRPIVFGSDFPHGEGLAYPAQYAQTQLRGIGADDVHAIMRGNLANFIGLPD